MLRACLGRRVKDGLMWDMDLKAHASGEFSMAVVQANSYLEDQTQVFTSPSATFVGVYDGHGGPEASRFANYNLLPLLHRLASEQGGVTTNVIKKAFSKTEEDFLHLVNRTMPFQPQIASVGSCCLVGAITNDMLYVANLGDSRAVLGRLPSNKKEKFVVAERLSTDHNVSVEEVRKEVEALHPDDAHIVVYNGGWRIKGIIQVSRSIGDVYLKKPTICHMPLRRPVITAEPSILKRKIKPQDLFLIFATDGLWDQLSDQTAVEIVSKNPRSGIAKRLVRAAVQKAAKKREMSYSDIKKVEKGKRRHFHDDISVVVIYLDHQKSNDGVKFNAESESTTAPLDIFTLDLHTK